MKGGVAKKVSLYVGLDLTGGMAWHDGLPNNIDSVKITSLCTSARISIETWISKISYTIKMGPVQKRNYFSDLLKILLSISVLC